MTANPRHWMPWLFALMLATWLVQPAHAASDAEDLVRNTTAEVLSVLRSGEKKGPAHDARLTTLVEQKVLPHFDFERMTRLAAGRNWSNLNDAQRTTLVAEFRTLLVRTYSVSLTRYEGQDVDYLPSPPPSGATNAVVKTRVGQHGKTAVSIDYRMNLRDGKWKVYDILVDGISLAINYRSQFNSTIESSGVDGLIDLLRNKNASAAQSDAPA